MSHQFCVAPMMGYTDRHCRYLLRLISKHAILYTEMVAAPALMQGNTERLLQFHQSEHPLALQLGGSDPEELARCARLVERAGYDEINLNVGCPSNRVQSGRFGACLMAEPDRVARCVDRMHKHVTLPITVKTRIGIDHMDSYESLHRFISSVAQTGCETFVIHARKAWLNGLSPRQNREVPPLRYERVHRLKQDLPRLNIVINGGLRSLDEAELQLKHVNGIMMGREVYNNPYILAEVDGRFYHDSATPAQRNEVFNRYLTYLEKQCARGVPLIRLIRPLMGLFQGQPGARNWRRKLSEVAHRPGTCAVVIDRITHESIDI